MPDGQAQQSGPELERQNGIAYVTGGIGDVGQERTLALGEGMSMHTVFSREDGAYFAGVDVAIKDRSGKTMIEVQGADPLLFADVPPGRYEVTASFDLR